MKHWGWRDRERYKQKQKRERYLGGFAFCPFRLMKPITDTLKTADSFQDEMPLQETARPGSRRPRRRTACLSLASGLTGTRASALFFQSGS